MVSFAVPHPSMWYRALAVVGVLYGSFFLLSHNSDWSVGTRERELVGGQLGGPSAVSTHQAVLDRLYSPDRVNSSIHGDHANAWKDHNSKSFRALLQCLATETCSEHQTKVVILQEQDYRNAFFDPVGGEKIWGRSVINTLELLGVTSFFSLDNEHLSFYYNMLPKFIRAVIMHPDHVRECWAQEWNDDCLKTSENPHGVRIQDLFTPEFFGSQGSTPFGPEWALIPEAYGRKEFYLGYSIQNECMQRYIPPHPTRPRRVWVLAKHAHYFTNANSPISRTTLVRAAEELNVEFVSAFHYDKDEKPFPGVTNLGKGQMLTKAEFENEIVNTLAIVGLGDPVVSPTPWFGLCWSLPFLNPTITHTNDDGTIRIGRTQHEGAMRVGEPHVYNFQPHDDDAFIESLRKAIEPHERFVPHAMTQDEMSKRVLDWLDRDWKALVEEKLKEEKYINMVKGKDFLL